MNIGHVLGNPPTAMNGVVASVSTSSEAAIAAGHQAKLVFPNSIPEESAGERWHALPGLALPWQDDYRAWLAGPEQLARVLREFDTDLVHGHHLFQTGELALAAARQIGRPLIVTMHTDIESYAHYVPVPVPPFQRFLMRRHATDLLNRVDQIIVPTEPVGELLESYGISQPMAINPTGIRCADYQSSASDLNLEELGINPSRPFILLVSRLAAEKDPWLFVEAFHHYIGPRFPELQLVLVGPGPFEQRLRRYVRRHREQKNIIVTGRITSSALKPLFRRALLFAYPSATDTQAIVITEAMAAGLAVVAVKRLGPAKIVKDNVTGRLVEHRPAPEDRELQIRLFASAILELLTDERGRATLGQAAEIEAANYDLAITTAAQLAIYASLLK